MATFGSAAVATNQNPNKSIEVLGYKAAKSCAHSTATRSLLCAPLMVVGTADRNLVVFNLQNPQTEFKRINSPLKYQTRCVAAFPDQQGFWVGSIEGRVGVHHLDDSQQSKNFTFKCHRDGSETCSVISLTSVLYITLLQLLDLMVHLLFGTRIVNSSSRPRQGAGNLYLAVHSIMMARYLRAWCVMTGVMGQKITTLQQQRLISICTCHR